MGQKQVRSITNKYRLPRASEDDNMLFWNVGSAFCRPGGLGRSEFPPVKGPTRKSPHGILRGPILVGAIGSRIRVFHAIALPECEISGM